MILLNKLITPRWQKKAMINPVIKPEKAVFSKGYFCLGLLLLTAFALQELGNLNWPWLAKLQADDVYKQLSGYTLVGYLALHFNGAVRCSVTRA